MNNFKVLDLFSGMGGFSYGFSRSGFKTTGVDIKEEAGKTYRELTNGEFIQSDLHTNLIDDTEYDVVIGGPPCRPWSSINMTKRGIEHPDYTLVSRFVNHVKFHKPKLFMMENVPPLSNDLILTEFISLARNMGYSVNKMKVTYSDFGASIRRTRLIVSGVLDLEVNDFFRNLSSEYRRSKTVKDSIYSLRDKDYGAIPDHIWPNLTTIKKYTEYYNKGKYGWRLLKWNEPAPSFGNVMKTYTLHPDSSLEDNRFRTISVAEASRIMGFPKNFVFPKDISMGQKYQMIVDSVSPVFSIVVAKLAFNIMNEEYDYVSGTGQ